MSFSDVRRVISDIIITYCSDPAGCFAGVRISNLGWRVRLCPFGPNESCCFVPLPKVQERESRARAGKLRSKSTGTGIAKPHHMRVNIKKGGGDTPVILTLHHNATAGGKTS